MNRSSSNSQVKNDIEQNMKSGAAIAFAHGLNVHFNLIEPIFQAGCRGFESLLPLQLI